MKKIHRTTNIILVVLAIVFILHHFVLRQDVANFTFGVESGPNKLLDYYYQYYQLDKSINNNDHLREDLQQFIDKNNLSFMKDGLLVFRIIIDKKGIVERIRYSYLDHEYKHINISNNVEKTINQLSSFLRDRTSWEKGRIDGKPRKYHLVIKLKVINQEICEIF